MLTYAQFCGSNSYHTLHKMLSNKTSPLLDHTDPDRELPGFQGWRGLGGDNCRTDAG